MCIRTYTCMYMYNMYNCHVYVHGAKGSCTTCNMHVDVISGAYYMYMYKCVCACLYRITDILTYLIPPAAPLDSATWQVRVSIMTSVSFSFNLSLRDVQCTCTLSCTACRITVKSKLACITQVRRGEGLVAIRN
jgi:hypothetical protein